MECSDCGRDLQPDFNFCPGCGKAIDANDQFKQSVDESFDKLEEVVKGDTLLRAGESLNAPGQYGART